MQKRALKRQEAQLAKPVAEVVTLPDGPMNLQEAAIYLRQRPRTIRAWMLRGLPYVRVTKKVLLFTKQDINEWLARRRTAILN
jgi:hypothetical protein